MLARADSYRRLMFKFGFMCLINTLSSGRIACGGGGDVRSICDGWGGCDTCGGGGVDAGSSDGKFAISAFQRASWSCC